MNKRKRLFTGRRLIVMLTGLAICMTIQAQSLRLKEGLISKDVLPPVTEESKDEAFDKPASNLVGTWYRTTQEQVYQFDSNGLVTWSLPFREMDGITILLTHQWTWKKKGDKLSFTPISGKGIVYKVDPSQKSEFEALSARRKNNIQEFIKSQNAHAKSLPGVPMDIKMLTADVLVLNHDYYIKSTSVDKLLKSIADKKAEAIRIEEQKALQDSLARVDEENRKIRLKEEMVNEPIYDKVDELPRFKDSDNNLQRYQNIQKYLYSQLRYPQDAIEREVQGSVLVKFAVMKDGSVDKIQVVKSVDPSLDKEAMRVVKKLPELVPGKKDGQPVNSWFVYTAGFKI